jgi:hypothetical protein
LCSIFCCYSCALAGILNNLDYNLLECQGLVLAPTRELAQQIEKVMRALGDYLQVKCHACVGGTSVREDARILSAGGCVLSVCVGAEGRAQLLGAACSSSYSGSSSTSVREDGRILAQVRAQSLCRG